VDSTAFRTLSARQQSPSNSTHGKYRLPNRRPVHARKATACISEENAHRVEKLPGSSVLWDLKKEGHSRTVLLSPTTASMPVRHTEYGRY